MECGEFQVVPKTEIILNPEIQVHKERFERFFNDSVKEENPNSNDYDGNYALERESLFGQFGSVSLPVFNDLVKLFKDNPGKYNIDQIYQCWQMTDNFLNQNGFDLSLVRNIITERKLGHLPKKNSARQLILKDILDGKIKDFNEKYFNNKCGGKDEVERIKRITKHWKDMKVAMLARQTAEMDAFKEKNELVVVQNEPAIVSIVEVHAKSGNNFIEEVSGQLPDGIKALKLRILYSEMTKTDDYEQSDSKNGVNYVADASGNIPKNELENIFQIGKNSILIFAGGNLRGCASVALESIFDAVNDKKPNLVDLHIPLDECYDNRSYDGQSDKGRFPTKLIGRLSLNCRYEVYYNEELVETFGYKNLSGVDNPRFRMYLWSRNEEMTSVIFKAL